MKTPGGVDTRLRIALLVDRFGNRFGGAEAYGVELVRQLSERHDVTVIARDYDSDLQLPYMKVCPPFKLPSWMRVLNFAWRASRLTRGGRFDIVHSHMNGWAGDVQVMHVTPVRYNRICALPAWRRPFVWLSPRLATYLLLERARVRPRPDKRVVAVSALIVEQMRTAYGDIPLATIAPGVQVCKPFDADRRAAMRERLGCKPGDVLCLLVARNPMRKGLPTLLDALERLPARYRLLVVGADAPTKAAVARRAVVGSRISLVDPTQDVGQYYEAADLYTHPTLNDSFGMAPLEAMSHHLPVVISASGYCGFACYLTHAQDALILKDPRDARELADAISLIGEDEGLRRQLIAGGDAVACARSWQSVTAQFEAIYREIVAQRQAAGS
ncbi:glycosyltransferase family 4 protein [Bordetella genomosp. 5]|uniref:Transferase n=1 Tax=Bordetella genomosp. 5 TaxID=1395608 RepID=A0A261THK7_9BORD|nr:glycosyltransferase family 4 protein [Bordetella genomosp. 5]OZI49114.1 transferase [Bordetella genomosp. 5]